MATRFLVKVAQRVAALIRGSDVIGRISGDEFLLVLEPIARATATSLSSSIAFCRKAKSYF